MFKSPYPGAKNLTLDGNGFYISYNSGASLILPDSPDGETALCIPDSGKMNPYYILKGDFRTEYEALVPKGLEACMEFFNSQSDKISSWSNRGNQG